MAFVVPGPGAFTWVPAVMPMVPHAFAKGVGQVAPPQPRQPCMVAWQPGPQRQKAKQRPGGGAGRAAVRTGEVLAAVESLYADRLRPYSRILRKRIGELAAASGRPSRDADLAAIEAACGACPHLCVQPEEGGEWSALLRGARDDFMDVYCTDDVYPRALWDALAAYFDGPEGSGLVLPGGRYAAAQVLRDRGLPFLAGRSLGELCHVVQLAITQKRILGYTSGTLVAYRLSQSMVKETLAESKAAPKPSADEQPSLPHASWEALRAGLREMAEAAPAGEAVSLSMLKRTFQERFGLELSETRLGHAKLSELMQDPRLSDLCAVRLQRQGHVLLLHRPSPTQAPAVEAGAHDVEDRLPVLLGAAPRRARAEDGKPMLATFRARRPQALDDELTAPSCADAFAATPLTTRRAAALRTPFPATPSPLPLQCAWQPLAARSGAHAVAR